MFLLIIFFLFKLLFCEECVNSNNNVLFCNLINEKPLFVEDIGINISHSNFSNFIDKSLIVNKNGNVNFEF
jgi:hypothetical protein